MSVLISLEKTSKKPLFRQVIESVIALVESGALISGDKLPPSRVLARQLGVNRSTVSRAYEELWSLGYLESRPGSYSYVRARPGSPVYEVENETSEPEFEFNPSSKSLSRAAQKEQNLLARAAGPGVINFIPLSPDPNLIPTEDFRRSMNRALAKGGAELLQYGHSQGFKPLRETIARRMGHHGVRVGPDEILITVGAQHGLDLLCKLLVRPGRPIALESPTYSRAIDLFRLTGAEVMEVPLSGQGDRSAGLDLTVLEGLIKDRPPAFIYTIPNFHNPTGLTTTQAHRERLLDICTEAGVPLIEDGFEEEMKYFGRVARPIKSMDWNGVVIYLGTFSKVLFPGLRVGWIAASKGIIDRLAAVNQASIIASNLPGQAALDHFCRQGLFGRHIRKMHRVYRGRMEAVLMAMEALLDPARITWTRPTGGYVVWLGLKNHRGLTEEQVVDGLLDHGLAVMPGGLHYFSPPPGLFFRLSIAHLEEAAIEKGIKRLAQGLAALN